MHLHESQDSNDLQTVLMGQGKYKMSDMCILQVKMKSCLLCLGVTSPFLSSPLLSSPLLSSPPLSLWFMEKLLIYWTLELFLCGGVPLVIRPELVLPSQPNLWLPAVWPLGHTPAHLMLKMPQRSSEITLNKYRNQIKQFPNISLAIYFPADI